MDKININLIIADRSYPLKINPTEEESVRKAAKMINERVRELQTTYDAKDKQDFLAMCALQYAVETLTRQSRPVVEDETVPQQLEDLDKKLDELLDA